jgi:hypothetical protein
VIAARQVARTLLNGYRLCSGQTARTLREFVSIVEQWPTAALDGHLHRGDFSKWIEDVFGDHPLAKTVQQIEEEYRAGKSPGVVSSLVLAIRSRYDFVDPLSELRD